MGTSCVTPTFTDEDATLGIYPDSSGDCIPESVTEATELLTEDLLDILTEADEQIQLEEN